MAEKTKMKMGQVVWCVCKGCGEALNLLSGACSVHADSEPATICSRKTLNTWESACLRIRTVIWCSSKWLSRSPGVLVQPSCTLPASSAGTWAHQASALWFCVSEVIL